MSIVLVVDDDELVRDTIAAMLAQAGYDVRNAKDGRDALSQVSQTAFDAIVTDLFMPDVDGIEIILAAQRQFPRIPLVAVSGGGQCGSSDLLDMARRLGAVKTLRKPFAASELEAAVRAAILSGRMPVGQRLGTLDPRGPCS